MKNHHSMKRSIALTVAIAITLSSAPAFAEEPIESTAESIEEPGPYAPTRGRRGRKVKVAGPITVMAIGGGITTVGLIMGFPVPSIDADSGQRMAKQADEAQPVILTGLGTAGLGLIWLIANVVDAKTARRVSYGSGAVPAVSVAASSETQGATATWVF